MLSERVKRARNIVEAGLAHQVGKRAWLVPGTNGKKYLVTHRKGELRYRCELDCGGYGYKPCKGNGSWICYHTFQAILASAASKGNEVSFCRTAEDAELLTRLGGKSYHVRSAQGSGEVWVVVS